MKRRTLLLGAATLPATGWLTGCGGGDDVTKAQVRLVNAADVLGYPSLDMRVDGALRQGDVAYGGSAAYVEVDPDKALTTISATGSPTALLTFTPSVTEKKHYTVLAFGGSGGARSPSPDSRPSYLS